MIVVTDKQAKIREMTGKPKKEEKTKRRKKPSVKIGDQNNGNGRCKIIVERWMDR